MMTTRDRIYVMLAGIIAARAAGALGVTAIDSWPRGDTSGACADVRLHRHRAFHADARRSRMVPPALAQSGTARDADRGGRDRRGGGSARACATARASAWALAALLVAMFPANVYASRTRHTIGGRPHTPMPDPRADAGAVDWAADLVGAIVSSRLNSVIG